VFHLSIAAEKQVNQRYFLAGREFPKWGVLNVTNLGLEECPNTGSFLPNLSRDNQMKNAKNKSRRCAFLTY
jgi:hypothetical protein